MKKYCVYLLMVIFLAVCVCNIFGQTVTDSAKPVTTITAEQVLESAKIAIRKNYRLETLKSLSIEFDTATTTITKNNERMESTSERKLSISFPNQIRDEELTNYPTNQNLKILQLDVNRYSNTSETLIDGKPFYFGSNLSSLVPKYTKEQQIASLKSLTFQTVFPITLDTSLYDYKLSFKYIGEAESKDGKADVIEVTQEDNAEKFQMFFDKKSRLLVMTTEKFFEPLVLKREINITTYYSEYKEVNGLLVAHKIIVQTNNFMTRESKITKFEINPTFKAKFFEVKEEQINPF